MKRASLVVFLLCGWFGLTLAQTGSTGDLVITSNIKEAVIILNGEKTDQTTPAYFSALPEGDYVIELIDKFNKRIKEFVTIAPGQVETLSLDFEISQLTIMSNMTADSIFINNRPVALSIAPDQPAVVNKLVKGDYVIRIIENRYGAVLEDKIFLQSDVHTVFMESELGSFTVTSNENKARIMVNGRRIDRRTPATFTDMPTGVYEISLTKGLKKAEKTFRLRPNTTNNIAINFEKSHFWKYVAAGVGLIGVSTATYFLTREEEKPGLGGFPTFPEEE